MCFRACILNDSITAVVNHCDACAAKRPGQPGMAEAYVQIDARDPSAIEVSIGSRLITLGYGRPSSLYGCIAECVDDGHAPIAKC